MERAAAERVLEWEDFAPLVLGFGIRGEEWPAVIGFLAVGHRLSTKGFFLGFTAG